MSGYVYFIACQPMEAVKIGFTSSNPHFRLSSLQIGCPAPLRLLTYVPGSMDDERRLHRAFAPLHIQGEWFRLEGKLRDFTCYLVPVGLGAVSRESFEGALHDVLMQGIWHPNDPMSEDAYLATGDWEPFHEILWRAFGPWEDA